MVKYLYFTYYSFSYNLMKITLIVCIKFVSLKMHLPMATLLGAMALRALGKVVYVIL